MRIGCLLGSWGAAARLRSPGRSGAGPHRALGLLLAGCAGIAVAGARDAGAGAPAKVTLAWVAVTGSQAVAWIAAEGGYFRRNGLDVDLEYISGSPTAAAALVSGSLQFVQMAGPAVVAADAHGAHEVMVMGFVNRPVFVLMTAPEIQTPEQLRGKIVAVSKVGSSDDFMLRELLAHWGLRPNADVQITAVGSVVAQLAALEKRLVHGAVVDPPNDVLAADLGARALARVSDLGVAYQAAGLVTTREYIQAHPEVVLRIVRAMTEAIHRIKTDKPFALRVMAKYLRNENPRIVEASYTSFAPIFQRVPAPTRAGLEEIVKQLRSAGELKEEVDVGAMLDTSFVDVLQQSGFIDSVYGR